MTEPPPPGASETGATSTDESTTRASGFVQSVPHAVPIAQRPPFAPGYTAGPDEPFEPGEWARIQQALERSHNYWVTSVRPDGRPHAMPVWGLWFDQAVWFSTGPQSVKALNLFANPECVIHLESGDDAVILEGRCVKVESADPLVTQFAEDYHAKYDIRMDLSDPEMLIFRMRPRKALTWLESNFPTSNARWYFA